MKLSLVIPMLVLLSWLPQPRSWVWFWTCRLSVTRDLCIYSSFYLQCFPSATVIGLTPTISLRGTFPLASLHRVHQYQPMYVDPSFTHFSSFPSPHRKLHMVHGGWESWLETCWWSLPCSFTAVTPALDKPQGLNKHWQLNSWMK